MSCVLLFCILLCCVDFCVVLFCIVLCCVDFCVDSRGDVSWWHRTSCAQSLTARGAWVYMLRISSKVDIILAPLCKKKYSV